MKNKNLERRNEANRRSLIRNSINMHQKTPADVIYSGMDQRFAACPKIGPGNKRITLGSFEEIHEAVEAIEDWRKSIEENIE